MTQPPALSERELEILRLVATGASNKEIALRLYISPNTVKVHLRNIFAKIGAVSRTEATLYALRNGLVTPEPPADEAPEAPPPELPPANPPRGVGGWLSARLPWVFAVLLLIVAALAALLSRPAQAPPAAPTESARWQTLADLPQAVRQAAAVPYENTVFLFGAADGAVWAYLPLEDCWQPRAAGPAVSNPQAVLLGETIYLAGGRNAQGAPLDRLYRYDPRRDRWEAGARLPDARGGRAAAALDGRLYLFGGQTGDQPSNVVWVYDPQADSWSRGVDWPHPRADAAAVALAGKIYLIGGRDAAGPTADVDVYYPQRAEAWESRAPLPAPRAALRLAVLADQIYAAGGESLAPALQYLPQQDRWQELEPPAQPVPPGAALAGFDTHLHLLGGEQNQRATALHLRYQAVFTVLIPIIR